MLVYETILILKPVLSDPEVADFLEKTKQSVAGEGGDVVAHEVWGRRKLTHMIGRNREGVYTYLKYKGTAALVKKLSHNLSLTENVMRHMTVLASERKMREPKKAKVKAAAAPTGS